MRGINTHSFALKKSLYYRCLINICRLSSLNRNQKNEFTEPSQNKSYELAEVLYSESQWLHKMLYHCRDDI